MEWLPVTGLAGLLIISFLAATILPLSSEAAVILLLTQGVEPIAVLATATVGNVAGSCVNYAMGTGISVLPWMRRTDTWSPYWQHAESVYKRFGKWVLLASWLPVFGDLFCILAGIVRMNFWQFTLLVLIAKLGRYLVVFAMVSQL